MCLNKQTNKQTNIKVQYNTVQCSTVQYSTVQCTVQYSTVQYSTVQYSTVQYKITNFKVKTHKTKIYNNTMIKINFNMLNLLEKSILDLENKIYKVNTLLNCCDDSHMAGKPVNNKLSLNNLCLCLSSPDCKCWETNIKTAQDLIQTWCSPSPSLKSTTSQAEIKTAKCQPPVRDTLVVGPHPCSVGVGVPDRGLTRPNKKITERKNYKKKNKLHAKINSRKVEVSSKEKCQTVIKTKKCQPPIRDTLVVGPHPCSEGVGVPDRGLTRPNKKITERKNYKKKNKLHAKINSRKVEVSSKEKCQTVTKTKKCQPPVRDTLVVGPHPCSEGVGVPDGGLTRPKIKIIKMKNKMANRLKNPWISASRKSNYCRTKNKKTKKCQPPVRDTLVVGPHPCSVGVGVPDGGLTRPNKKRNKKLQQLIFPGAGSTEVLKVWKSTHKSRNKLTKIVHGNGRKSVTIQHWNMGARNWIGKTDEARQLLSECNPDIFIVTEANLFEGTTAEQRLIEGYSEILPLTMELRKYCRVLIFVKDGLIVKTRKDFMDTETSSIWVEIARKGKKSLMLGAIYREHSIIRQQGSNSSAEPVQQNQRWRKFLKQWKKVGEQHDTYVIGDTNLDYITWQNPTQVNKIMTEETKLEIETLGFHQLVAGITRSWRGQKDSCLDQIWTNVPDTAISISNFQRGSSDHNVVGVTIRVKGSEGNCQEFFSRKRSSFNLTEYREELKNIQWEDLYAITNLEAANHWVEDKIGQILQKMCPLRVIQPNKRLKSWICKETILVFKERDLARNKARETDSTADWTAYRNLRNKATKLMRANKKKHFSELFNDLEVKNNVKGLYSAARTQLGLKKPGPPQKLCINGKNITAPAEIANVQVNFYKDKIEKLVSELPRPTENPLELLEKTMKNWSSKDDRGDSFSLREVTVGETLAVIKQLGSSSAFSHDCIDSISIKSADEILAPPITFLANLSISQEKFH